MKKLPAATAPRITIVKIAAGIANPSVPRHPISKPPACRWFTASPERLGRVNHPEATPRVAFVHTSVARVCDDDKVVLDVLPAPVEHRRPRRDRHLDLSDGSELRRARR